MKGGTQSNEGRVTEKRGLLCILPLQRAHTDCVHVCVHAHVQLFATAWTVAHQARILKWVAISYSRGSSWPRVGSNLHLLSSYIGRQIVYLFATWEAPHTDCCCCRHVDSVVSNWTMGCDLPGSSVPGILRQEHSSGLPFPYPMHAC